MVCRDCNEDLALVPNNSAQLVHAPSAARVFPLHAGVAGLLLLRGIQDKRVLQCLPQPNRELDIALRRPVQAEEPVLRAEPPGPELPAPSVHHLHTAYHLRQAGGTAIPDHLRYSEVTQ